LAAEGDSGRCRGIGYLTLGKNGPMVAFLSFGFNPQSVQLLAISVGPQRAPWISLYPFEAPYQLSMATKDGNRQGPHSSSESVGTICITQRTLRAPPLLSVAPQHLLLAARLARQATETLGIEHPTQSASSARIPTNSRTTNTRSHPL